MQLLLASLSLFNLTICIPKAPMAASPTFLTTPTSQDCTVNNFHVAYWTLRLENSHSLIKIFTLFQLTVRCYNKHCI